MSREIASIIERLRCRRRCRQADAQLPDALTLLANALRAGLAFPQALEMAAIELPAPLGEELAAAVAQLKLGSTIEEALGHLRRRLPTEEIALVVQSVAILRRTGGNLAQTFTTLAATVEGRLRVEERIRVLTAQGVIQGAVLAAMPWALALALHVVAPDYLAPLFSTRLGWALVALAALLEVAGALWLRRVVWIRV